MRGSIISHKMKYLPPISMVLALHGCSRLPKVWLHAIIRQVLWRYRSSLCRVRWRNLVPRTLAVWRGGRLARKPLESSGPGRSFLDADWLHDAVKNWYKALSISTFCWHLRSSSIYGSKCRGGSRNFCMSIKNDVTFL